MNDLPHGPITGKIQSNLVDRSGIFNLTWKTNAAPAEVYVSEGDETEKLISTNREDSIAVEWIQPGKRYLFRLYDSTSPRRLIDQVEIYQAPQGNIAVEADHDGIAVIQWNVTPQVIGEVYLMESDGPEKLVGRGEGGAVKVMGLSAGIEYLFRLYADIQDRPLLAEVRFCREVKGSLLAEFNSKPFDSNPTALLRWDITRPAVGAIYLSENGGAEKLVGRGESGAMEVMGVGAGTEYLFRLYADVQEHPLLDEVRLFREAKGNISAELASQVFDPNPVTILRWDITAPAIGEIYLVENGGAEKLVGRGGSRAMEVMGLGAGVEYLFRLYADTQDRPLLDEAKLFREVAGKISADPNPVTVEAGSTTVLRSEITPPATAEICVSENGGDEKLVYRGASGSLAVSALQPDASYLFRLYSYPGPRRLLDEVKVSFADIPWRSLTERFAGGRKQSFLKEMAEFIAAVIPECLGREEFAEWFRLWEKSGFHVTPVHFYEPIPNLSELSNALWHQTRTLPGIEMNPTQQRHLLCDVFPSFVNEYKSFPLEPTERASSFHLHNGRFEGLDPLIAYCMVRHFKPERIIEVGSGYSTLLLAQAARANGATEVHSVEPYPVDFLTEGVDGLSSLLVKRVEELEPSFFDTLGAGDFLFIDTSHVVRIGGDVNFLFLEVLPRLNPGVFVHVHDIFLPREYPREWVMERRRFWTEQYLLQAFLAFNSEFEVLVSSAYLHTHFLDELKAVFPAAKPWLGGSFWIRRKRARDASA